MRANNQHQVYLLSYASSADRPPGLPSFVLNLLSKPHFVKILPMVDAFKAGIQPKNVDLNYPRDITIEQLTLSGVHVDTVLGVVDQNPLTNTFFWQTKTSELITNCELHNWEQACRDEKGRKRWI